VSYWPKTILCLSNNGHYLTIKALFVINRQTLTGIQLFHPSHNLLSSGPKIAFQSWRSQTEENVEKSLGLSFSMKDLGLFYYYSSSLSSYPPHHCQLSPQWSYKQALIRIDHVTLVLICREYKEQVKGAEKIAHKCYFRFLRAFRGDFDRHRNVVLWRERLQSVRWHEKLQGKIVAKEINNSTIQNILQWFRSYVNWTCFSRFLTIEEGSNHTIEYYNQHTNEKILFSSCF